jgi:hypothetical protein
MNDISELNRYIGAHVKGPVDLIRTLVSYRSDNLTEGNSDLLGDAQGSAAGIIVAYDSTVTVPCSYKLINNFVQFGETAVQYVAQRLHRKGHALEIRGVAVRSPPGYRHAG